MKIVLGLGNPGSGYARTRHNVGFRVVESLADRAGVSLKKSADLGRVVHFAEAIVRGEPVVLAEPRTYMNRSGIAAAALCERYRSDVEDLVVVYDDADLALGRVRVRGEGGTGGHNGIRSLLDTLRIATFARVRLGVRGVGREEAELADYVLEPFREDEEATVSAMVVRGADAVETLLESGLSAAMNAFNVKA